MSQSKQNFAETIAEISLQRQMYLTNDEAVSLVNVPQGYQLEDTEKYQLHRNRFRGEYNTQSSKSFAQYVIDRGNADKCFIDNTQTQAMTCKAIFNLGDEKQAGHGDDIAKLRLNITDEFNALCNMEKVNQRQLVDFIQDYAHCLTFCDADDDSETTSEMSFAHALKAFRSVTIKSASEMTSNVGDLSASKSALEKIEADSAIRLPRLVKMQTSLYDDLPETEVTARVAVLTGDSLGFSLRIIAKQKQLNDAGDRFVNMVNDILPENTSIYVGTFNI